MIWRLIIIIPLSLILVLFALSNTHPVQLGFWPTDFTITVPLSLAVLSAMGVTFLVGALLVWMRILGARARARRAERNARLLEAQVAELKAEVATLRHAATARSTPLPNTQRALLPT